MVGEKATSFESYSSEVASKSKALLKNDNPQVRQDIERFRGVKAIIDRAEKMHEEAKKTRNRLQKRSMRIQAASLLRQAQEKVPELEQVLDQQYSEVKGTVTSRMSSSLRYLEYSLERFLKMTRTQVPQHEQAEKDALTLEIQSPLDGFME